MKWDKFTELEISLKLHVRTTKFLNYKPVNNTENVCCFAYLFHSFFQWILCYNHTCGYRRNIKECKHRHFGRVSSHKESEKETMTVIKSNNYTQLILSYFCRVLSILNYFSWFFVYVFIFCIHLKKWAEYQLK